MTTEKKIGETELAKALSALQNLAKGSAGGSAPSTMLASEAGESGATQLFHTASDSDPGTWAGTSEKSEGWEDHVEGNGTDYKAAGKAMAKAIQAKLMKGEDLTKNERMFIAKGGMKPKFLGTKKDDGDEDDKAEKALPTVPGAATVAKSEHKDEAEDKKLLADKVKPEALKGKEMGKSLSDYAQEDATVARGLEVSEFLAGFASAVNKSLHAMEARLADRVVTTIVKGNSEGAEVQKSLAEALSTLGEVLTAHAQRLEQVETGAARAPKSTMSKSQGEGEVAPGERFDKSLALDVMIGLVQKGELDQVAVVKYDSTGEMTKTTEAKVRRAMAGH